jgi:hypothetical protein
VPKKIATDANARILEEISRHYDGIGMDALHARVNDAISRRSLQRRLARFVAEGRLVTEGKRRALRYRIAPITLRGDVILPAFKGESSGEVYISLSPEGQKIKDHVRQPRQMRIPVGYNQSFLEEYYPNETSYLPSELRNQLRTLGTPHDGDRPAGTFARDIMNRLLIDLSWASSRLEGNTYSRLDTERLIEFGRAVEGKDSLETQMILNHKAAIELLVNEADLVDFTPYTIFSLHALVFWLTKVHAAEFDAARLTSVVASTGRSLCRKGLKSSSG